MKTLDDYIAQTLEQAQEAEAVHRQIRQDHLETVKALREANDQLEATLRMLGIVA